MRGRRGGYRSHEREYGRTTITVPCQLKQRMKSIGDYVNWSSVACKAFEQKLNEFNHEEQIENVDQVVERLRKLNDAREDNGAHTAGVEVGRRWAMNRATPNQLAAIESFRKEVSAGEWRELFQTRRGARELALRLMGSRHDERERGVARMFWSQILDERPDGTEFFAGFADGALEIWNSVKDRI